jgi:hypothetical protein
MLYSCSNPLFQPGGSEIASLRASRLVAPVPYANYFFAGGAAVAKSAECFWQYITPLCEAFV